MRKLPTGEPCAGEPHARFGGRGRRKPFPTPIGLKLIVDEAKKSAKVERDVLLSDVADLSMLREAQRELGIKPR